MKKSRKSTIKRLLVLMSEGGRDWEWWELVAIVLLVGAFGLSAVFLL